MFNLAGRVVVVSGASSGLGAQLAKGFAKQGADLVITARRMEKLKALAVEIRALGVKCLPIKCDVTNTESVNSAAEVADYEEKKFWTNYKHCIYVRTGWKYIY